jgi:hypothetical protein
LDCSCVIMRVGETTRVYMRAPENIAGICKNMNVRLNIHKVNKVGGGIWACDIGPIHKPLTANITLDNQNIPLIVTE